MVFGVLVVFETFSLEVLLYAMILVYGGTPRGGVVFIGYVFCSPHRKTFRHVTELF